MGKPPDYPQKFIMDSRLCPLSTTQNCLYLNVFTPSNENNKSGDSFSLMIFIHGGFVQVCW